MEIDCIICNLNIVCNYTSDIVTNCRFSSSWCCVCILLFGMERTGVVGETIMATVIGYEESVYKKFTCSNCAAIVKYTPSEDQFTTRTDEGRKIRGLKCPGCGQFHRTNH